MADDKKPAFTTVIALRPDTSGHNLLLKVLEAKLIERPPRPPPGKAQRLAECTVGDETGVIFLTARNEQVNLLVPGAYVTVRNARTEMLRGSMRLGVDRFGKVEAAAAPAPAWEPRAELHMSLVEYELVPVPAEARQGPAAAAAAGAAGNGDAAAPADGGEAAGGKAEAKAKAAAPPPAKADAKAAAAAPSSKEKKEGEEEEKEEEGAPAAEAS